MNDFQVLRFTINTYWDALGFDNLYDKYKKQVLKVEHAKDLDKQVLLATIESFRMWIKWLADWMVEPIDAIEKLKNIIDFN